MKNTTEQPIEKLKLEEQYKHEKAKREITEIKLALIKGKVHRSEDVERVMTDMLTTFKAKIRVIPIKLAAQIKPTMNMSQISTLILKEIDNTLTELSSYDPNKFYSSEYAELIDDEDEEIEKNEVKND